MSYIYRGKVYSIESPVTSISVNKLNVVVKNKKGTTVLKFDTRAESKHFLASLN